MKMALFSAVKVLPGWITGHMCVYIVQFILFYEMYMYIIRFFHYHCCVYQ